MFRTSLKRSATDYKLLHSRLNDSAETTSANHSFEGSSHIAKNTFGGREYQLLDAVLHPTLDEEVKFKTKHVPMCLINSPAAIT